MEQCNAIPHKYGSARHTWQILMSAYESCGGDPVCEMVVIAMQPTEEHHRAHSADYDGTDLDDLPPMDSTWFQKKLTSRRKSEYPIGACFQAGQLRNLDMLRKMHSEGPMPRHCFGEFMKGFRVQ